MGTRTRCSALPRPAASIDDSIHARHLRRRAFVSILAGNSVLNNRPPLCFGPHRERFHCRAHDPLVGPRASSVSTSRPLGWLPGPNKTPDTRACQGGVGCSVPGTNSTRSTPRSRRTTIRNRIGIAAASQRSIAAKSTRFLRDESKHPFHSDPTNERRSLAELCRRRNRAKRHRTAMRLPGSFELVPIEELLLLRRSECQQHELCLARPQLLNGLVDLGVVHSSRIEPRGQRARRCRFPAPVHGIPFGRGADVVGAPEKEYSNMTLGRSLDERNSQVRTGDLLAKRSRSSRTTHEGPSVPRQHQRRSRVRRGELRTRPNSTRWSRFGVTTIPPSVTARSRNHLDRLVHRDDVDRDVNLTRAGATVVAPPAGLQKVVMCLQQLTCPRGGSKSMSLRHDAVICVKRLGLSGGQKFGGRFSTTRTPSGTPRCP